MERPILAALLSLSGPELKDDEKHLLSEANPIGISLFKRNISSPQQLKNLITDIKSIIGRDDVIIAIDQEGGRVRRLSEPDYPPYAGQQTLGRLYHEASPAAAQKACFLHASLISQDLKGLGINLNYAPSLDLIHPDTTPALSSRCLSEDSHIIGELGRIMVDTYITQGIIPCIKHLPGHGQATTDPHLGLPIINKPLSELADDFRPFIDLNDSPCGMTAHIVLSALDTNHPITQSPIGINFIRQELGFKGFLISDAIDMHALKGTISDKAEQSLRAGCDCVCYCGGNIAEMQELVAGKHYLEADSLSRFAAMTQILHNQSSPISLNYADYAQLVGTITPYQETYDATEVLFKMSRTTA